MTKSFKAIIILILCLAAFGILFLITRKILGALS
jgi:hypothetical protein